MTGDPTKGKFNEQRTFVAQMPEAEQRKLKRVQTERAKEEQRIRERQDKTRDERIEKREAELTKKAEHDMQGPRPDNVPPPKMPTRDQIKKQAVELVREADKKELSTHDKAFDLAEKKLIEKALQRDAVYQKEQGRER